MATQTMAPQATVATMSVNVQVMKIGNRQVTLSMFKQFEESDAICDGYGNLQIMPWGYVNYHIGCESMGTRPHLHVVWACDQRIQRGIMLENPFNYNSADFWHSTFSEMQTNLEDIVGHMIVAMYAESRPNLHKTFHSECYRKSSHQSNIKGKLKSSDDDIYHRISVKWDNGYQVIETYEPDVHSLIKAGFPDTPYYKERFTAPHDIDGNQITANQLVSEFHETREAIMAFKHNWQSSYEAIKTQGQLFIAV